MDKSIKPDRNRPDTVRQQVRVYGKDERNLMEWLVGVLDERVPEGTTMVKYSDTVMTMRATKDHPGGVLHPVDRDFIIRTAVDSTIPGATERDILVALSTITRRKHDNPDTVLFTIYELCKIMHKDTNGLSYKRIVEGLMRLKACEIIAINAFWDKEGNLYKNVTTGILQDIGIASHQSDKTAFSWVTFSRLWAASIEQGYFWFIDTNFYFSLKTPTERRLFQVLNGKRHGNANGYTTELDKWAHVRIGVPPGLRAFSAIKRRLAKAHATLIKGGFLTDVSYSKNANGEWQVTYKFGDDGDVERLTGPPIALPNLPLAEDSDIEPERKMTKRSRDEDLIASATGEDREEAIRRVEDFYATSLNTQPDYNTRSVQALVESKTLEVIKERLAG